MLGLVLAAGLVFTPADAKIAYTTARTLVEEHTPRNAGTIRGRLAANYLLDAASIMGADVRRDAFTATTPEGERQFTNLYAEFRSGDPDARWVVVISHFDTKTGINCPGANDGASTSGLLVGIANAMSNWEKPKGNLLLIWADGEECYENYGEHDGLWGSRRAAAQVAEKGYAVQAVICVDMLGDRDLQIHIPANSTPTLAKIAVHAARRIGYPKLVTEIPELMKDDHVPFIEGGFKAVDLIDFSYGPKNSYWHTDRDCLENISEESLLKSGKLLAEMLNILL